MFDVHELIDLKNAVDSRLAFYETRLNDPSLKEFADDSENRVKLFTRLSKRVKEEILKLSPDLSEFII